ncbi:MAG: TolC family protein [Bacteroidales bacterium]
MSKRAIFLLVFVCGFLQMPFAQTSDTITKGDFPPNDTLILRLSLDDAIDLALKNNWDVKLAQQNTLSSNQDFRIALAAVLPKVGFSGTYNNFLLREKKFNAPNTDANPTPYGFSSFTGNIHNFEEALSFSQVLFNYASFVGVKFAQTSVEIAKLAENVQEQETILAVKMAYYDILLAKDLLQVSEESYSYSEANFQNVQKYFKQGLSSEYDLLQAEVQLANSEPQVIQAHNNLALAYLSLKSLLALDLQTKIEIESGFSRYMTFKPFVDSLPAFSPEKNYSYQSLERQKIMARHNISIMNSNFWPVLNLVGEWELKGKDNNFRLKDYYWTDNIQLGVSLSFNIFNGFSNRAQSQQAKIAYKQIEIQIDQLKYTLTQESIQYKLNLEEAYKRIQAQQKGLETARKALNIAFSRYLNGVGTQLEIINNQSLFTEARSNFSQAIYDFLVALASYKALQNIR